MHCCREMALSMHQCWSIMLSKIETDCGELAFTSGFPCANRLRAQSLHGSCQRWGARGFSPRHHP